MNKDKEAVLAVVFIIAVVGCIGLTHVGLNQGWLEYVESDEPNVYKPDMVVVKTDEYTYINDHGENFVYVQTGYPYDAPDGYIWMRVLDEFNCTLVCSSWELIEWEEPEYDPNATVYHFTMTLSPTNGTTPSSEGIVIVSLDERNPFKMNESEVEDMVADGAYSR